MGGGGRRAYNSFRSHICRGFAIRVVLGLGDGAGGGKGGEGGRIGAAA